MNNTSQTYETFHRKTKPQKRVIGESNFTYRSLLRLLTKHSVDKENFLDIGCGSGVVSFFLASKGKKVVGLDISRSAIETCRKSARKLGLEDRTSFNLMDFPREKPGKKFDFIICSEVLEHIEDDQEVLKEIYQLLYPGGLLIISVPSKNAPLYKVGLTRNFDVKVGHLRRYDLEQLVNLCAKFGFSVIETRETEGILRNFLFLNPMASKAVRFIRGPIADFVTALDNIALKLFGESQLFVVAQKDNLEISSPTMWS